MEELKTIRLRLGTRMHPPLLFQFTRSSETSPLNLAPPRD